MENRISFIFANEQNYPLVDKLIWVQAHNFHMYEDTIQDSIDSFHENVYWREMWDLELARDRVEDGQSLFIGYDDQGPLAHVWFENNYLYNLFANPRRPRGYTEKFIKSCLNFVPFHTITLQTDEWNIRAQNLFLKVGFTKFNSYI